MDEADTNYNDDFDSMENIMRRSLLAKNKLAIIIKGPDGDVQYCCVQCPVRCNDKENLEKHLFTHSNEYRHLCGICGTGLKRKEHLDRHTLEHQQVRPHACDVCGKAFKRKEHLNIHKSIHSGDKTEVCMLCNKSFYRKDHLQKHLQTHSKTFQEQNLSSVKAEVMEIDVSDTFEDSSQDAQIEEIETIPDQHLLVESYSEQIKNEERPYACPLCEKTYKRKDHLKLHSHTHLAKDKICTECGKAFHTDEQLFQHMSMHLHAYSIMQGDEDKMHLQALLAEHNIDPSFLQPDNSLLVPRAAAPPAPPAPPAPDRGERRHQCDSCPRKFKRRQHLIVHQSRHAKNQPNIWCSICRQGFFTNTDFESHPCMTSAAENSIEEYLDIKIEHPPPTELGVKIANPPADAKKENEYPHEVILPDNQHADETQYPICDESRLPTPTRVYVCKYCQKPFRRKDHYKIHLHIHTGVKSFFCPDCGKGFYRKDHLQKHSLVHAKPKAKAKKALPDLYPISLVPKKTHEQAKEVKPEITIHAPSNTKLRVPLQIKVPYQVVMSMGNGEQRAVTIDPQSSASQLIIS